MEYVLLVLVIVALGAGVYLSRKSNNKSTIGGGSGGFDQRNKKDRDGRATE